MLPEQDGKSRLIVFAGQSNMLGHAKATGCPKPLSSVIRVWNNAGNAGAWVSAQLGFPPFNTRPGAPNNAALVFACLLQEATGGEVFLAGLPVNGSTLLSWCEPTSPNMARLLREMDCAISSPDLRDAGVTQADTFLWHQGESDDPGATMVKEAKLADTAAYARGFHHMIAGLAAQAWWRPVRTNIIAGELVSGGWLSARNDFYCNRNLWSGLSPMGVASSEGLTDVGDRAHFDCMGLTGLGKAMFLVWQQLVKKRIDDL